MNARIYSLLLIVFPADVRMKFGAEMTDAFREDFGEQWRSSGLRGAAQAWRRCLADLLGAALQEAILRRQFVAPSIAFALLQLWAGFVCLMHWEPPSLELVVSFSLYGLICALIAFAVARLAENAPETLKLERR